VRTTTDGFLESAPSGAWRGTARLKKAAETSDEQLEPTEPPAAILAVPTGAQAEEIMADTTKTEGTLAGLKERLGEVFDEIFTRGRQFGREEGYKAGFAEGAKRERERIRAAFDEPPGGEPAPAATGATVAAKTAPETPAAEKATGTLSKIKQVLATETAKATDHISKFIGDVGREPLPGSENLGVQRAAKPSESIEARCKAEWDRESGLRAEFGTLDTYVEFVRQREAGS
jgi:hypothetical protein